MIHIELFVFTIILYEVLYNFKFLNTINKIFNIYKKLIKIFTLKKISDSSKEKSILKYSKSLFINSLKLILLFISIIIIFLIFNYFNNNFGIFVLKINGILEVTSIFLIYNFLRKHINEKL